MILKGRIIEHTYYLRYNNNMCQFFLLFIFTILFLSLVIDRFINHNSSSFRKNEKSNKFLIYISSCNRFDYLNKTIHSFVNHMTLYENISYHIVVFDQGTVEFRYSYNIKNNQIYNIFFMNPNGYIYTYDVIFSYFYSEYVLLIDDDRPIRENIEKYLKYTNFISISLGVMDKNEDIFGVILKSEGDGKVKCSILNVDNKDIRYCKVEKAFLGFYYSNGASIYKSNILKRIETYTGEQELANYFATTNYRMAYLLLNNQCNSISNLCNYLCDHIGIKSALKNINICSLYLY